MNERLNWMFPSFYVGRVLAADVRASWSFVLIPIILFPHHGLELSLAFTGLLALSSLLHELTHVCCARATGGSADEIHLTPIGGLYPTKPGQGARGLALTSLAGPALNFLICLFAFPGWYAPTMLWAVLDPFTLPIAHLNVDHLWLDLGLMLFAANWVMLLANLLPALPLDGGQLLRALLSNRIHPELIHRTAVQVGLVVSLTLLITGAIFDLSLLVLLGTFILTINLVHWMHEDVGVAMDESSFGYDFSAAYESLDAANPTATRQTSQGLLQRWREGRRLRREQQERMRRMEAEQQLDFLLAKVHETGLKSLSEEEQQRLRSCSELIRSRPKNES